jgi:hypothetical protein
MSEVAMVKVISNQLFECNLLRFILI